jgi:hypothetical protein
VSFQLYLYLNRLGEDEKNAGLFFGGAASTSEESTDGFTFNKKILILVIRLAEVDADARRVF